MARMLDKKVGAQYPFEYVPSHKTDIRERFKAIAEQQRKRLEQSQPVPIRKVAAK